MARRPRRSGRADPPGGLTLRTRGGVLTVRLTGEVDLWLRDALQDAVAVVSRHDGPVEIDLEAVTFFGAEGTRMLLAMHRARPPGSVTIVGTSTAVERTLRVCGITADLLPRPRPPS